MSISIFDYAQGFFKERCQRFKALHEPVHLAISGGRSSAALLALLLELHDGKLPANYHLIFTNTGKEHHATYAFLAALQERWGVAITWLEMTKVLGRRAVEYKIVDAATAGRHGQPFEALLRDNVMVPRRKQRLCTFYMKVLTADQFCADHGLGIKIKMFGFRADEHSRLYNMQMINAGINKQSVLDFWSTQPFDLGIDAKWGNCDFCFLKGRKKLMRLAMENPSALDWWVKADQGKVLPSGKSLYMLPDGGYAALQQAALAGRAADDDEGFEDLECNCTD